MCVYDGEGMLKKCPIDSFLLFNLIYNNNTTTTASTIDRFKVSRIMINSSSRFILLLLLTGYIYIYLSLFPCIYICVCVCVCPSSPPMMISMWSRQIFFPILFSLYLYLVLCSFTSHFYFSNKHTQIYIYIYRVLYYRY